MINITAIEISAFARVLNIWFVIKTWLHRMCEMEMDISATNV